MVTKSYVREGKDLCLSCVDFSIIFSIKMEMSYKLMNILYIMMPYSVSNLKSDNPYPRQGNTPPISLKGFTWKRIPSDV